LRLDLELLAWRLLLLLLLLLLLPLTSLCWWLILRVCRGCTASVFRVPLLRPGVCLVPHRSSEWTRNQ
jgi:hypothetical protein